MSCTVCLKNLASNGNYNGMPLCRECYDDRPEEVKAAYLKWEKERNDRKEG